MPLVVEQVAKVRLTDKPQYPKFDPQELAEEDEMAGAEWTEIVNQAESLAAYRGKEVVEMQWDRQVRAVAEKIKEFDISILATYAPSTALAVATKMQAIVTFVMEMDYSRERKERLLQVRDAVAALAASMEPPVDETTEAPPGPDSGGPADIVSKLIDDAALLESHIRKLPETSTDFRPDVNDKQIAAPPTQTAGETSSASGPSTIQQPTPVQLAHATMEAPKPALD
jgi:hypothetical protein